MEAPDTSMPPSIPALDPGEARGGGGFRGHAMIAWMVIVVMFAPKIWTVVSNSLGLGPDLSVPDAKVVSIAAELTGKVAIGGSQLSPGSESTFIEQIKTLASAQPGDRIAYAMLTSELVGPEAALSVLDDESIFPTGEASESWEPIHLHLLALVRTAIEEQAAGRLDMPALSEDDRDDIELYGGWVGRILLLPAGGPDATAREEVLGSLKVLPLILFGVLALFGTLGLGGLIGLIFYLVRARDGLARHGFAVSGEPTSAVYIETFAVWTVLFMGWQYGLQQAIVQGWVPGSISGLLGLAGFFGSLLALAWPVWRGLTWRRVREDIGWVSGRGVAVEAFGAGPGGYAMVVPIAGLGLLITFGLLQLQTLLLPDAPTPSHPAQTMAGSGDLGVILSLYVLACIAAPILEETMFRGVLFRYLRESSRGLRTVKSFLVSALISSFMFAAIHPQGVATIPVLMGLAIGFCLIREWRGAILPSMVAHGINNFLIVSLNVAMLGI